MFARAYRSDESGFSLPEVLIAAAIAAAVLIASAQSIGGSARLTRSTSDHGRLLLEAQAIAARLRAGMTKKEALDGFIAWEISQEPFTPVDAITPAVFERIIVMNRQRSGFTFELIIPIQDGDWQ